MNRSHVRFAKFFDHRLSSFPFVLLVQTGEGDGFVAGSMWVEDSHVKEGYVEVVSPEPVCLYVESSIVFSDGSGVCHFFTIEGL